MQFLLYTRVTTCMYQNQAFLTFRVCLVQHVCVRTERSLLSTCVWYNVHVSELSIPYFPHVSGACVRTEYSLLSTRVRYNMYVSELSIPYFPHMSGTTFVYQNQAFLPFHVRLYNVHVSQQRATACTLCGISAGPS